MIYSIRESLLNQAFDDYKDIPKGEIPEDFRQTFFKIVEAFHKELSKDEKYSERSRKIGKTFSRVMSLGLSNPIMGVNGEIEQLKRKYNDKPLTGYYGIRFGIPYKYLNPNGQSVWVAAAKNMQMGKTPADRFAKDVITKLGFRSVSSRGALKLETYMKQVKIKSRDFYYFLVPDADTDDGTFFLACYCMMKKDNIKESSLFDSINFI